MARRVRPAERGGGWEPGILDRLAWTEIFTGSVMITRTEPLEKKAENPLGYGDLVHHPEISETGDDIILWIPSYHGSNRSFKGMFITDLREDELINLRKIFNLAIDAAMPIVKERDRIAEEAYENGETYYVRCYRPKSRLIINARTAREQQFLKKRENEDGQSGAEDHDS